MGLISRVSSRTYRVFQIENKNKMSRNNSRHFDDFFNNKNENVNRTALALPNTDNNPPNDNVQEISQAFGQLMSPFKEMDNFFGNSKMNSMLSPFDTENMEKRMQKMMDDSSA